MLILIFGIYCAAATLVALGLLRGGSCLKSDEAASGAAAPEEPCCSICRNQWSSPRLPLNAGLGLKG